MHEFESGFFGNREPAWHGLGTVIEADVVGAQQALEYAGLAWDVEKIPVFGVATAPSGEEIEIPSTEDFMIIRADRMERLGMVGSGYTPLQNIELLEFMEALQDTDEATIHTAGSLRRGRVVWATAKLAKGITIAGMESEEILPFLMCTNSHDGKRSMTAVMTPIRTVCMNTLTLALRRAVRTWSIRHTSSIQGRLQEAREALGIAFTYMEAFEKTGNALVRAKLSKKDFAAFLEQLVPYDEEMLAAIAAGETNRGARNVDEARDVIRSLYETSPNLDNVRGTRWAAVNAVAEYVDFAKPQRNVYKADGTTLDARAMGERRFVKVLWETDLKQRSLKLLAPELAHARGDNLDLLASSVS